MSGNIQEFKSILIKLTQSINSNPKAMEVVKQWLSRQYGKIIGWKIRSQDQEENYHMIFTQEIVKLNVGEYPAFDIMIIGSIETILGIVKGEKRLGAELKQKNIMVWGNLNEGLTFEKVMGKIKRVGGN